MNFNKSDLLSRKFSGSTSQKKVKAGKLRLASILVPSLLLLAGCTAAQTITHGTVVTQDQVDLIPVGSSQDQVLLALGTPSHTNNLSGDIYYYISQKRVKQFEYQRGTIVDQKVLAVYFDDANIVSQVADYGIQDGKVFDFISRTTPTSGKDFTFLTQILTGRASPSSVAPRAK